MAQIVTITNPLTGQPAQVDQLEHTAQEIDDAIARALPGGAIDIALQNKADKDRMVNPNLLDNWYFAYPVNQRNVSGTIDTVGYFLDRWKLVSGSVTIGSNGITLNGTIVQIFETAVGTDVTASALTTEGVVEASYDNNSKTLSLTGTGQTFVAVKLELGITQTLAHKENGNWQLNEIPDYGEQLARCQRYFQIIPPFCARGVNAYGTSVDVTYKMPTTMRTIPSATFPSDLTGFVREIGNKNLTPTSIILGDSPYSNTEMVTINFICSGMTVGRTQAIIKDVPLSADL